MNIITSVYVKGLWGHQDINILIDSKTNFIIGVNGTGKTTLINLLAAALTFDYDKLLRIEFESITIRLKEVGGSRRPSIRVVKDISISDDVLTYEIQKAAKDAPIVIPFDSRYERMFIETKDGNRVISRRRVNQEVHTLNEVTILLKELIKVSWL
ncbi:TPA: AAA family ATPase, partial [Escherichia coli]